MDSAFTSLNATVFYYSKCMVSRSLRDAHSNEFENYMKTVYPEMLRIEISNSKLAGYPRDCFGQLNEVKKLYSMSGQRFIDPEFPPTEASLYKKESPSGSPTIDSSTTFKSKFPCVEWKRAPDFLARRSSTNLKVFSGAYYQQSSCFLICVKYVTCVYIYRWN